MKIFYCGFFCKDPLLFLFFLKFPLLNFASSDALYFQYQFVKPSVVPLFFDLCSCFHFSPLRMVSLQLIYLFIFPLDVKCFRKICSFHSSLMLLSAEHKLAVCERDLGLKMMSDSNLTVFLLQCVDGFFFFMCLYLREKRQQPSPSRD